MKTPLASLCKWRCGKQWALDKRLTYSILGSTYTGVFENVKEMSDLLDAYEAKTGIHIPIHVDAASGGFVAPFVYPDLEWDFKIPRVQR